jgi:hypothetical protein
MASGTAESPPAEVNASQWPQSGALLMPRQFRLRSLFILTAIVAVECWVGPPALERYREYQRERARVALDRYINNAWRAAQLPANLPEPPPTE